MLGDRRWPPKPDEHEQQLLLAAAASDQWTDGPFTADVERRMEAITGAPYAVAFNSCTSAIHAALYALGCRPGTRVAAPALSFAGTVTGAGHIGALLSFTDVDPYTLNMHMVPAETTVAIVVDLHGVPHTIPRDRVNGRLLLTDSCQALGTRMDGQHIGAHGTHAWSFSSAKMVTAPDGGAVTTDDLAVARMLRGLRDYGIESPKGQPRANGAVVWPGGHNWRPSELSMALVSHRLNHLDWWVARTRAVTAHLQDAALRAGLWVQRAPASSEPAWHKVRIGSNGWDVPRSADLEQRLNEAGVPTHRWGTLPLHRHPAYAGSGQPRPIEYADAAAKGTFCLGTEACPPMTWTDSEVEWAAHIIETAGKALP